VANGAARVDGAGLVRILGAFIDGTRFALHSTLNEAGESPFYTFRKPEGEVIIGWFQFGPLGDVGGPLYSVEPGTNGVSVLQTIPQGQ
jgi:hypothetical protein